MPAKPTGRERPLWSKADAHPDSDRRIPEGRQRHGRYRHLSAVGKPRGPFAPALNRVRARQDSR